MLAAVLYFTPDEFKMLFENGWVRSFLFYRWGNWGSSEFRELKQSKPHEKLEPAFPHLSSFCLFHLLHDPCGQSPQSGYTWYVTATSDSYEITKLISSCKGLKKTHESACLKSARKFSSDKGNGFARNKAPFRTPRGCGRQIRIHPASLFHSQSPSWGVKGIQTPVCVPKSWVVDSVSLSDVAASCQWLWLVPASSVPAETLPETLGEEGEVSHMLCCSATFLLPQLPIMDFLPGCLLSDTGRVTDAFSPQRKKTD